MNWLATPVALLPLGVVTVTPAAPSVLKGTVAVINVAELITNEAAGTAPNCTALAAEKPLPVMATVVPPAMLPAFGLNPLRTGGTASTTTPVVGAVATSASARLFPTLSRTGAPLRAKFEMLMPSKSRSPDATV